MEINQQEQIERLKSDKFVYSILLAHLPFSMWLVPMGYGTGGFAFASSLIVAAIATIGYFAFRGQRAFSIIAAVCLMLFSAILIQAQLGRIEMHFHIFATLGFLLIYRDWVPLVVAAGVIAVHHLLLTYLQLNEAMMGDMPVMLFNYGCSWSITFLHATFVVIETAVLVYYAIGMGQQRNVSQLIITAVNEVAQNKNLTSEITQHTDEPVVQSFNLMTSEFSNLMRELKDAVTQLSDNGQHLTNLSKDTNTIVDEQTNQTQQASTATNEMTATIHDIAKNAAGAASAAQDVDGEVKHGNEEVKKAVNLTHQMNSVLGEAGDSIKSLEGNVNNISSVVDVIHNISEQTNLLALNAAIEAARAGEQGRGFAVVADEVRTLAQRTQESTQEIQSMIEALQKGTQKVVHSMNSGQEQAQSTSDQINKAGSALAAISQAIVSVTNMNDQIATAAEEQSAVAEHINENVHIITQTSEEVVSKTNVLDDTAVELNQLASHLQTSINRYTV